MKHVGQYINLYKPVQHEVKLKVFIRYFNFNSSCQKLIFLSQLSLLHAIKLSPMCYLTVQAVISKLTTARAMELKGIKPIKICLHPPPEVDVLPWSTWPPGTWTQSQLRVLSTKNRQLLSWQLRVTCYVSPYGTCNFYQVLSNYNTPEIWIYILWIQCYI